MTDPKQKAQELVSAYAKTLEINDMRSSVNPYVKQCAIILCEECIKINEWYRNSFPFLVEKANERIQYWQQVLTELKNM